MLGVHNTAANWDQFLISLQAGILNSLLIGLLVGLLLLLFERRLNRRNEQHQYEREVTTFQERLRFVFTQPSSTNIAEIIESPPLVQPVDELLAHSPLELWRNHVPKQKAFFQVVRDFQQSYSNFTSATNALLVPARIIIRSYNHRLGKISSYDTSGQLYFLGRIQGFEGKIILPWLWRGTISEGQLPYFETMYNVLSSNGEVNNFLAQYKDARAQLGKATRVLKEVLMSRSDMPKTNARSLLTLLRSDLPRLTRARLAKLRPLR